MALLLKSDAILKIKVVVKKTKQKKTHGNSLQTKTTKNYFINSKNYL